VKMLDTSEVRMNFVPSWSSLQTYSPVPSGSNSSLNSSRYPGWVKSPVPTTDNPFCLAKRLINERENQQEKYLVSIEKPDKSFLTSS
jgi:hypothetical protein